MADALLRVEVTDHFLARLDTIEALLEAAAASAAFDRLLDGLRQTVVPNVSRFPRMGRRFADLLPRAVESLAALRALALPDAEVLREYLHEDYLILYAHIDATIYLLSIRHHRELAYDLASIWPNA